MSSTPVGGAPSMGTSHLVARGPTFGQIDQAMGGDPDIEAPPTFSELKANSPAPSVPAPAYGGYFGSYSGNGSRPHSGGGISAPSPSPWKSTLSDVDVAQYQHGGSGSQMPSMPGKSAEGEAEGEAGAGGAAGGAEGAGAAEAAGGAIEGAGSAATASAAIEAIGLL